jgi:SAM-dependent methyltransferase
MTRARLKEFGVRAEVQQADAESLPYNDATFDFVWSWGVIHHSARTTRIVREIARVLKPEGQTRVMVYNRDGTVARLLLMRHYLFGGEFIGNTPDETLWRWTDGYSARYYHKEQAEDLFRGFFEDVRSLVLGMDVDVVPLPRPVRKLVVSRIPDGRKLAIASRLGGFLFVMASNPVPPRHPAIGSQS